MRDPRGTIASRHHREDWCPGNPDCEDPERLCSDLESDYHTSIKFSKLYQDRFMYVNVGVQTIMRVPVVFGHVICLIYFV